MHCSWDPQLQNSAKFSLKLGPTTLFTYLKIILLQCFQFSTINGIQTNPKYSKSPNSQISTFYKQINQHDTYKLKRNAQTGS